MSSSFYFAELGLVYPLPCRKGGNSTMELRRACPILYRITKRQSIPVLRLGSVLADEVSPCPLPATACFERSLIECPYVDALLGPHCFIQSSRRFRSGKQLGNRCARYRSVVACV